MRSIATLVTLVSICRYAFAHGKKKCWANILSFKLSERNENLAHEKLKKNPDEVWNHACYRILAKIMIFIAGFPRWWKLCYDRASLLTAEYDYFSFAMILPWSWQVYKYYGFNLWEALGGILKADLKVSLYRCKEIEIYEWFHAWQ